MPFSLPEALADFPEALALINKIADNVADIRSDGKVSVSEVCDVVGDILPELGRLIEKIAAQAKD